MVFLVLLILLVLMIVVFKVIGSLIGFALMVLLAGLIGAGAQSWLRHRGSFLSSIGAGLGGAVLGIIVAKALGAPTWPSLFHLPLLWTVVGSVAVVAAEKVLSPLNDRRLGRSNRRLLR